VVQTGAAPNLGREADRPGSATTQQAATKNVLLKHGVRGPFFGVNAEDLKSIQKRIKLQFRRKPAGRHQCLGRR